MSNTGSLKAGILPAVKKRRRDDQRAGARFPGGKGKAADAPEPLCYGPEDIEEANRIGAARRRQHAR